MNKSILTFENLSSYLVKISFAWDWNWGAKGPFSPAFHKLLVLEFSFLQNSFYLNNIKSNLNFYYHNSQWIHECYVNVKADF